jgi:hypothetical protein
MKISADTLNALFQQEDIEGYINLGAPSDEYTSEAANVAAAISQLESNEITEENITALLILEWMRSFDLSEADIALRAAALQRIARLILQRI